MEPGVVPEQLIRAPAKRRRSEELAFRPSRDSSVGVEVELQILDRESGDLAPGAIRVLHACQEDGVSGVSAELMQSMLEVKTDICGSVGEVREQLSQRLRRVRNIASSMGYDIGMAGTHPFHRSTGSAVFPDERYEKILDRLAWMIHQRVVFGLHVHIGMPSGDTAIGVINMLVQYTPHLLALSASSPFWQGIDTGLASCRSALYRSLPHAGVPRYFPNWKGFRTFCRVMRDCKAIASPKDIYWDIRPRPELGTIEFRMCDQPMSLAMSCSVVALIRSLVLNARRLLDEFPQLRRGDMRRQWIAVENKWLATRYGMGAMVIRTPGGKRRPLDHDLGDLIQRLLPIARESGDERFLANLLPVEQIETGADRQRRLFRDSGDWKAVIRDMTSQFDKEIDALTRTQVAE
jgi:carboxylate-amine ligase